MSEVDTSGVAGIIIGVGTAAAAVIGALRLQRGASRKPEPADEPAAVVPVPLPDARSPEDVLKFMAILQADNVSLRAAQTAAETWRSTAERTIDDLVEEVRSGKDEQVRFRDALGRYLTLLFREWGKSDQPPLPAGDDLVTLRDVIPRG